MTLEEITLLSVEELLERLPEDSTEEDAEVERASLLAHESERLAKEAELKRKEAKRVELRSRLDLLVDVKWAHIVLNPEIPNCCLHLKNLESDLDAMELEVAKLELKDAELQLAEQERKAKEEAEKPNKELLKQLADDFLSKTNTQATLTDCKNIIRELVKIIK